MGLHEVIPGGWVRSADGSLRFTNLPRPTHAAVVGKTRRGKSVWAMGAFLDQVLVREEGGALFDPTSQAIHQAMGFLGAPGVRERVRVISREDDWPQVSVNMLDMWGQANASESVVARKLSAFVNSFVSIQGWNSQQNSRAINLTSQAAAVLLELGRKLPADLQPTLFQLPALLTDEQWRATALKHVRPSMRDYWLHEYPQIRKEAAPPVTHMIHRARLDPQLRALLGASRSTFDWRRAMDERWIVLVCLGEPGDEQKILANLLLYDLVRAFFSRGDRNTPSFLTVLDELHTYDGAAGGSVADVLEQTGKYGGVFLALTQNFLRLKKDTQTALLTNTDLLVAGTTEPDAARLIARGWVNGPDWSVLPNLPRYSFIADCEVGNARRQFRMRSEQPERIFATHLRPIQPLMDRLAGVGRTAASVTPELDVLDHRIKAHLEGHGGAAVEVGGAPRRPSGPEVAVKLKVVGDARAT